MITITPEYVEQNRILHETHANYGAASSRWLSYVTDAVNRCGAKSVLDYGCGKGSLVDALADSGLVVTGYDPAVERFSARPEPADLVVCTDVLEHVEPELLGAVLTDLHGLARRALFVIVSTVEAKKTLPDGRNAHLSVKSGNEWLAAFLRHYRLINFNATTTGFHALLSK